MKSKSEDVQIFAVDAVLQLSNLPQHSEVLDEKSKRSRNPLSPSQRRRGNGAP